MKYCVGIDLGSTTTKAVILGEAGEVLGRGITNSRSNYKVACDVALGEALINARFALISAALRTEGVEDQRLEPLLALLELRFREQQYRAQLETFDRIVRSLLNGKGPSSELTVLSDRPAPEGDLSPVVDRILAKMNRETA